ncbi:hypothetical protein E2C01_046087 [Portunus trituberculatus]|uniref:Uncharacterized protein n=1 Tax=Portunus trituberculatus TaxID=210409 RepID=A0A5B7G450_PORTR|nr:hypothetical protein [Portunus trituberculatus]
MGKTGWVTSRRLRPWNVPGVKVCKENLPPSPHTARPTPRPGCYLSTLHGIGSGRPSGCWGGLVELARWDGLMEI